jgi:MYXO-CTERM domain-containing protein
MMLALSMLLTHAAPPPDDPVLAKLESSLRDAAIYADPDLAMQVVVHLEPGTTPADLERRGLDIQVIAGNLVQGVVRDSALWDVAAAPATRRVRAPYRPRTKADRDTEGYSFIFGNQDWHADGITGAGARVAVVDVGFMDYTYVLGSELPPQVDTDFSVGDPEATEHGTAVAEIVHDMAPDAEIALYTFGTDVEFLSVVETVTRNGETLVSASIGFDNVWHLDGGSPYSQAVQEFVDGGGIWVAAAGNEADIYWVGTVTDSNGDGWLEMDGTDELPLELWGAEWGGVSLRWNEPFGEAGTDLDLYIFDAVGDECSRSEDTQDGDDAPYEATYCEPTVDGDLRVSIFDASGRASGKTVYLYALNGYWPEDQLTFERSLTLPADAPGAISVGAWSILENDLALYSSRGPTETGVMKPDIVAPTDVTTWSYGIQDFPGTSSATPHVSGALALWIEAEGGGTAADAKAWLAAHALDVDAAGPDNNTGYGLLRIGDGAPEAVEPIVCGCQSGPSPAWGLGLVALLAVRRRSSRLR